MAPASPPPVAPVLAFAAAAPSAFTSVRDFSPDIGFAPPSERSLVAPARPTLVEPVPALTAIAPSLLTALRDSVLLPLAAPFGRSLVPPASPTAVEPVSAFAAALPSALTAARLAGADAPADVAAPVEYGCAEADWAKMASKAPAIATVVIFTFWWTWNSFLEPFIYLSSPNLFPISLGLNFFKDQYGTIYYDRMIAASVMSMVPMLLIFFFAQRYFIEGIQLTGMKS